MLKGFRDFILRGNVIDLAVAITIGIAFTALVAAFTEAFIRPLIGLISGGGVNAGTWTVNGQVFNFTLFINAVITFLAIAAAVYFAVVVPVGRLMERRKRGEIPEAVAVPEDVVLLGEIRDLLAMQRGGSGGSFPPGPGSTPPAGPTL